LERAATWIGRFHAEQEHALVENRPGRRYGAERRCTGSCAGWSKATYMSGVSRSCAPPASGSD
jgi:hypothetical protein